MIDQKSMIISLRLALLKSESAWKSYLQVSLEHFGSLFLFHFNYEAKTTCHFAILLRVSSLLV